MSNVSVVPIVDTSASMSAYGYVAQTVIDTKAFLRLLKPGDKLAVVAYDSNARNVYTGNGGLATVDPALSVTASAAVAVGGLNFDGNSTAIGRGLLQSRSFLDNASEPRAGVLLTDGFQNDGPLPLDVLPKYRIMTCAMGQLSDQDLLQEIARRTGGTYFFAPRAADMMKVYNTIRATTASAALLANQLIDIPLNDYQLIPAVVSQGPGGAQISAVWSNTEVSYTRGSPSGNQLSVTLVDPTGSTSALNPTIIGDGFVIYNVDNPAPGQWYIQLEFAGSGQAINCTGGALQYRSSARSNGASLQLSVELPSLHRVRQPLPLKVHLDAGGEVLSNVRGYAIVQRPTISIADALHKYDDQLGAVQPHALDLARGISQPMARLAALRQTLLPELDILAHQQSVVHFNTATHQFGVQLDTPVAGSYSVQVVVSGESQASGPFQRCGLVSVLVSDQRL
ncbi:VWA domain-containing protein [Pseudomonas tructae]|uniref:VWA domain-containing protein n=1 Tax=Pseudomonas tructae TaxID=2518644 RepID=A0A411ML74_9PSED|nr:vWA domain-containing protein [Pseudomonas tructae]QBF27522.1 VWA domain-containing protein [Pseudomonas tructae]